MPESPQEMTPEQIAEARHAFEMFDQDANGVITEMELTDVLRELGQRVSEVEIAQLMRSADADHDGRIDYTEFLALMTQWMNEPRSIDDLRNAFNAFDADGDGALNAADLYLAMVRLGVDCTYADAEVKMYEADVDGDGYISFDEFSRILS